MTEHTTEASPGISAPRPAWRRSATGAVLLLTIWAVAGFFMGGEDELSHEVPWLVVLGGGVEEERIHLACKLFSEGNGRQRVVLTGHYTRRLASQRAILVNQCGVPSALLYQLPSPTNTFEELSAVGTMLSETPGSQAIVVSDSLHMPRLRYVRQRLALNGRVYLRQSHLGGRWDPAYLAKVAVFWFREPVAYVFYRLRY
jgi:uncharacterized SAM-binding protein YcdF (DUF218 family)